MIFGSVACSHRTLSAMNRPTERQGDPMSKQSERERFIAILAGEGIDYQTAQLLLRHGATLQRVAEAQCNGDWPYDNGERKVIPCSRCEAGCAPSAMRRDHTAPKMCGPGETMARWIPLICPDCRVSDRVKAICAPLRIVPDFQGDPRGYVLKLKFPAREGRAYFREEIGVPA